LKTKNTWLAAVLLAAINAAGSAAAQFPPPELAIHKVRDGIYQILSAASGGITVLISDDSVLLVDSKLPNEFDGAMEQLRTMTDLPIRYVINTHMHGDHTGGNIRLEGLDAEIIATENARSRLAATQSMGLPVFTFDDHMRIYFGGRPLDLYWLGRGHTDGDLVVHLPEDGLIMAGDLFAGFDTSLRLVDYNSGGSLMEWSATLEKVMELDFDTVIPGHQAVTDRAAMQGYLDETIRIQDMIRELHGAGRSPEDIQSALVSEFGRYAVFILPSVQNVIAELE
jgi:cyclase